ncbi:Xylanolytic transcriptional activator xlnR [Fulvia fulva]|nr:Xylanolytic transcriptional activator xlnR [Fulvia fulva]WPV18315.1 Xylanolytic transcriptional activator xlnR [Fulvia fulva]WPV33594.1 Xylanolytic transcriptional activator xlnR [Fulvia fulva]
MLSSAGVQQYPPSFGNGNMVTQDPPPQTQRIPTNGLDALAEGSQYAMQQLQQQQARQTAAGAKPGIKHRHSYSNGSANGMDAAHKDSPSAAKGGKGAAANGQPVRRRISRACDQCNQLRTKCDGQNPCAHCVEFGLTCEYARERKKRGKASRKDIAAAQAQAAAEGTEYQSPKSGNDDAPEDAAAEMKPEQQKGVKRRRSSAAFQAPLPPMPRTNSMTSQPGHPGHAAHPMMPRPSLETSGGSVTGTTMGEHNAPDRIQQRSVPLDHQTPGVALPTPRVPTAPMQERGMSVGMSEYGSIDDYHRSILHPAATVAGHNILHSGPTPMPHSMIQGGTITGYGESPYGVNSPSSQQGMAGQHPYHRMGESPLSAGFLGQSPMAGSPGWLSLPSPSAALYPHMQQNISNQTLRYPVLRPLLPHISAIIPIGLACDLLDLYFSSVSSAFMQPSSPYVLAYVFRKRSFLRPTNPRQCSPALLASMLWVAAQTSDSAFLTSAPSARGKICQKLLELTVGLLKPLIHNPTDATQLYGGNTIINGVALGGFGVALPGQAHDMDGGNPGATGALDDVAAYMHLATVVSASEYKAASLRWWNAAWSLARELKLGRELPPNPTPTNPDGPEAEAEATGEAGHHGPLGQGTQPGFVSEEEREERRRLWWLLYIVDRHLALCYNRPLFLLDAECDALMQPENDVVWQAGEYYPGDNHPESTYFRRRGPSFECTGHGIFNYFLPLMTMLGEIVDLNHARNHPRFGLRFKSSSDWDDQAAEITRQLEAYGRSLQEFEARNIPKQDPKPPTDGEGHTDVTSPHSVATTNSNQQRMTEAILQTKIVLAYGTHLMHTLHILVNGKWDPISLLDDNDLWISSQSFISATGHAVSAAEAINDILDYDPDLSFMPFFFGIYLLQGSFLLLLMADKLQGEASPSVVKACETIVRAHEACVVTLNTEYQRNFRKVMRSALAQVKGRMTEDFGEQQLRRREVLALYRWTGDGTGLAL